LEAAGPQESVLTRVERPVLAACRKNATARGIERRANKAVISPARIFCDDHSLNDGSAYGDFAVRKKISFCAGLLASGALALAALAPAPAVAADLPSAKEAPVPVVEPIPSGWRFEATINGWAPSLISNVGVRNLPTASVDVGFFTLLRHINGVAPITVTASKDNFLFGVDLFWNALTTGASFRTPGPLTPFNGVSASLHLDETILTGFAGVRLPVISPDLSLFAIAGARYFHVGADLSLNTLVPGFAWTTSQSKDWVDPIIGLTAHYRLNEKWFLAGEADVGGYNDSLTWQTFGAVGYNWTPAISTTLGFRALYAYEKQPANLTGNFRFQQTMLGPQLTIGYAF
jgi:hypothetical protein